MSTTNDAKPGETVEQFIAGLRAEVGGHVKRDGDVFVWSCTCGDQGEQGTDALAGLALYTHHRSGHKQVIHVEIGTASGRRPSDGL